MDVFNFFDSEGEGINQESDGARESISTDLERPQLNKKKIIKKSYEPIQDSGKVIKYQEDPQLYRKAKKKIQNRQSATRVRGRKKHAFQNLGQQVEYLRAMNSELLLKNAKLETENTNLRDQVQFMRQIIQPNSMVDPIDKYIEPNSTDYDSRNSEHSNKQHSDQLFTDESDFIRLPSLHSVNTSNWLNITIFTIIVAVFILPSETGKVSAAFQTSNFEVSFFDQAVGTFKTIAKVVVVCAYILFILKFFYKFYTQSKMKKT